jgi:hypothetical protein
VFLSSLCKKPLVLATLALNLICGNLMIVAWAGWHLSYSLSMAGCYSLSAVFLLLCGFTRIKAESSWVAAILLGVLVSLLIPLLGAFLYSLSHVPHNFTEGLLESIAKSFIWAILSMSMAAFLAIPFAIGNIIAFCMFKKQKQRKVLSA